MKSRFLKLILLVLVLGMLLTPAAALAEEAPELNFPAEDEVGNVFITDKSGSGQVVALDLYGAGQNVTVSGSQVGESALLAGYNVTLANTGIGGSLRAAAYHIGANDSSVAANATLAAYSIDLGAGFTAHSVYAAASSVNFSGVTDTMYVAAQNVTISGTVHGNAHIYADTVTVLDGAYIQGVLQVYASAEPVVGENAAVSSVEFHKVEQTAAQPAADPADVAQKTFLTIVLGKAVKLLSTLPMRIVLVILLYFIIRKTIEDGASMMKTRAVAMPISGVIALISVPIAAIIVMCTVIGLSAGALILSLFVLATCFAIGFAACMTGRLIFPKMHLLLACVLSAAIFSILLIVPVLGGVIRFACVAYTLGYFIQRIYLNWQKPAPKAVAAPAAVCEAAPETPVSEPAPETPVAEAQAEEIAEAVPAEAQAQESADEGKTESL